MHVKDKSSEATTGGVLWEKVFLETLQNSQENTCTSLFFKKVAGLRPATLLKKESGTGVSLWIVQNFLEHLFYRTTLDDCFSILQQSWRSEFSVLVSERILKKKVSGEIAFDLISLFHVFIQDPRRSSTTMRAFAFPSKLKFDTRSWWWPNHLCGWA